MQFYFLYLLSGSSQDFFQSFALQYVHAEKRSASSDIFPILSSQCKFLHCRLERCSCSSHNTIFFLARNLLLSSKFFSEILHTYQDHIHCCTFYIFPVGLYDDRLLLLLVLCIPCFHLFSLDHSSLTFPHIHWIIDQESFFIK